MKHKLSALLLALALVMSLGTTAFAATSTTASVPVTLTVSNEYRAVNVTVPASLPVMVINGAVYVADNAGIRNNSKTSAIQVQSVCVSSGAYRIGNYDQFTGSKRIALKINGCSTKGAGYITLDDEAFPVIGTLKTLPLTYYAKVSVDAPNAENVEAAHIVFTISIAD